MYNFFFKLYFALHDFVEQRFFYHLCKILKKPHPKNLYDYRSRDFLKQVAIGDRVADLGCGTGKLARQIAEKTGYALGIDCNKPLFSEQIDFIKMDILDRGLAQVLNEKKINVIVLSHVLEHLPEPVDFLKRLRPFKKILVCVPSQENWRFQFKQSLGLDARTDPTHFREYTIPMLQGEATQAGFQVLGSHYNSEGEIFAVLSGAGHGI